MRKLNGLKNDTFTLCSCRTMCCLNISFWLVNVIVIYRLLVYISDCSQPICVLKLWLHTRLAFLVICLNCKLVFQPLYKVNLHFDPDSVLNWVIQWLSLLMIYVKGLWHNLIMKPTLFIQNSARIKFPVLISQLIWLI